MDHYRVHDNVFAFTSIERSANLTIYNLSSYLVLIDAGGRIDEMKDWRKKIERHHDKKIKKVILTHFHSDHTNSLPAFSDCEIIANKQLSDNLKQANRKKQKNHNLISPNVVFDEKYLIIDDIVKLVIKHTGGHTSGSSYIFCPNYKVINVGDNLFANSYTWGGAKGANPESWIKALEEYLALDVNHVVPGHGPVCGKTELEKWLEYIKEVKEVIIKEINKGKVKDDVLKEADKVVYDVPAPPFSKKSTLTTWYNFWKKYKPSI
jgi:glyoxylase-like metal-dependent hydrolase (beta-lactamase superfamily II)